MFRNTGLVLAIYGLSAICILSACSAQALSQYDGWLGFRKLIIKASYATPTEVRRIYVKHWQSPALYPLIESGSSAVSDSRSGWDALGGLYALLAQHDALGGHALARKSVRSPSRRLRFGRRSDPDMPPQAPLDEMDELLSLREVRTPVRLRFGRRSDERAVPHIFPQEEQERDVRAPSMRLRFGRRSDNNMFLLPYESALPKDVKASSEDDRQQN